MNVKQIIVARRDLKMSPGKLAAQAAHAAMGAVFPKHVYVGLKHVRTGQVYENQYVSKHCSNSPTLHETINIQVTPFHYDGRPNDVRWEFNNLSKEICS